MQTIMRIARRAGLLSLLAATASVVAAAVPLAASAAPAPLAASAAPAPGPSWPTLQDQAATAVAGSRDNGPVTFTGVLSGPAARTPVGLVHGGSVPSTGELLAARDGAGSFKVDLDLLGSSQLVVTILGSPGTVLVLTPGTSTVAESHTVAVSQTRPAIASAGLEGAGLGSCGAAAYDPVVIGSIYGPLIDANLMVECSAPETIASFGSLSEWVYQAKTIGTGGGTVYTNYFSYNVYAPCTPVSWLSYFQDGVLASINGGPLFGGTSPWVGLNCALL